MSQMKALFKRIARLVVPFFLRSLARRIIFKDFRKLGVLRWLRIVGFLTCNKYIGIDSSNTNLRNLQKCTAVYISEDKDEIKLPLYTCGENLQALCSFTATTRNIVVDINNTEFSFRNNHLLDSDLNVIGELRAEELDRILPLPIYQQVLSSPYQLSGTIAYLSDPDPGNYYHWMCRVLPLLRTYQKVTSIEKIDFFYVGKFGLTSFHKESLEKLGIAMSKIVQEACSGDKLLLGITNRTLDFGDSISRESYLFSRSLFLRSSIDLDTRRRIYVKRGNTARRRILNENEVADLLTNKYDFSAMEMDHRTIEEQAEIFAQAEAIVATHGAALANLLFIQPNTQVIELMPYGYVNNCFYTLSNYGEANYFCLQSEKLSYANFVDRRTMDLYIDIDKLDKMCHLALIDKPKLSLA